MANHSRQKGLTGEREVAAIFQAAGLAVRGLEGQGDHLIVCADGMTLHSEVKRQETARVWEWMRQAEAEAPQGVVPLVSFRRNRGRWYGMLALDDLAAILPAPPEGGPAFVAIRELLEDYIAQQDERKANGSRRCGAADGSDDR